MALNVCCNNNEEHFNVFICFVSTFTARGVLPLEEGTSRAVAGWSVTDLAVWAEWGEVRSRWDGALALYEGGGGLHE